MIGFFLDIWGSINLGSWRFNAANLGKLLLWIQEHTKLKQLLQKHQHFSERSDGKCII